MRELEILELEAVAGGSILGDAASAIGNAAILAGRATYSVLSSSAGKYVIKNAGGNMALYGVIGEANGNGTTAAGYAGAALGGLVGGVKGSAYSGVAGQLTAGAAEGYFNGRGSLSRLFADRMQYIDEESGFA